MVFGPLVAGLLSARTPEVDRDELARIFLSLHGTAWLGLAALVLITGASFIVISHRVAGPLVRFTAVFDAVARGDLSARVRLRAGDCLQDDARALDRAVSALRWRLRVLQGRGVRIEAAIDGLDRARQSGSPAAVDDAIRALRREAGRSRTMLGRFTVGAHGERSGPGSRAHEGSTPPADWLDKAGFTIVELLLVMAIFGTLAAIALPLYAQALDTARVARAIGDVRAMGRDLKSYEVVSGQLPDTLAQADLSHFLDPWGRPYVYLRIAGGKAGKGAVRKDHKLNPINSDFDLYSVGKDGVTKIQLTNKDSLDDVVRANDGGFTGLARDF